MVCTQKYIIDIFICFFFFLFVVVGNKKKRKNGNRVNLVGGTHANASVQLVIFVVCQSLDERAPARLKRYIYCRDSPIECANICVI